MSIFFSILTLFILVIAFCNAFYAHIYKIVSMPSAPQTRSIITDHIHTTHGDCNNLNIYDLGSGYGGLCRKLSKKFPNAKVIGYEISPVPYMISKIIQICGLSKSYTIKRRDIFSVNLSNADIIVCYLSHYHMDELKKKLQADNIKNCSLYSQGFPIKSIEPNDIIAVPYSIERKLYLYKL